MPFYKILLLLACLSACRLCAQQMSGVVHDSSGAALAYATIVATACPEARVVAYASTDDKGYYRLQIQTDCDTVAITARALGYEPLAFRFRRDSLPAQLDLVLGGTGVPIREVVVRAQAPPVALRSDTTEYDARAFSDSTERSVEQLIKKLPGVRVDEHGSITYNGKPVERVMIEGDDLFSHNYTIGTRNIRADVVSKIQFIDRYQENRLLKGVQDSERLVMNLTLKEDKKRPLSGSVELGGGFGGGGRGHVQANLFSIGRANKTFLLANANNIGENAAAAAQWMGRSGELFRRDPLSLQTNPLRPAALLSVPELSQLDLPLPYTQTNRGGLVYVGEVLPISKQFNVKTSGYWAGENLAQSLSAYTEYLLNSGTFRIEEAQNVRLRNKTLHGQVESEFFARNGKHALRSFINLDGGAASHLLDLTRTPLQSQALQVSNQTRNAVSDAFGALEYTLKTGAHAVVQVVGKGAWHRNNGTLSPEYRAYADFFGVDTAYTRLRQNLFQKEAMMGASARLLTRAWKAQWHLEAGADWQWSAVRGDIVLSTAQGVNLAIDSAAFRNDVSLFLPRYSVLGSVLRTLGLWTLRLQTRAAFQPAKMDDRIGAFDRTATQTWVAEPSVSLKRPWGERATFGGQYEFRPTLPDLRTLMPNYLFADYQTLWRGLPDLALLNGHKTSAFYQYNDRLRQTSWNLRGNFSATPNAFGARNSINPYLILSEKFRPITTRAWSIGSSGERFFHHINMRAALGAQVSQMFQRATINSETLRNLNTTQYTLNAGTGTAFDIWVNLIAETRASVYVLRNTGGQVENTLRSVQWFSTLQCWVKRPGSNRFHLKWFLHHAANRPQGGAFRHLWASDCYAHISMDKWRSEFEIKAFNLLNSRKFEQVYAEGLTQSRTAIAAAPRFVVVSWSWHL